ncbi:hypothetical protein LINGRAHAP2_LOCUS5080 [Linum grandiflorum]
MCGPMAT